MTQAGHLSPGLLLPRDWCCAASCPLQPFSISREWLAGIPAPSRKSNPRRQIQSLFQARACPFHPPASSADISNKKQSKKNQCEVPKNLYFSPQTITTFDIILISSCICYFSTLGTRYRKYKHDLLNQRRHSIPLEKEPKKLEEQDRNGEK